jgi:hypothetical protein
MHLYSCLHYIHLCPFSHYMHLCPCLHYMHLCPYSHYMHLCPCLHYMHLCPCLHNSKIFSPKILINTTFIISHTSQKKADIREIKYLLQINSNVLTLTAIFQAILIACIRFTSSGTCKRKLQCEIYIKPCKLQALGLKIISLF